MQWVHVLGIIEFCAPHGAKFKPPCFGHIDAPYPKFTEATPSGPFGTALTYKVIKLYEDDSDSDPYDTHHLLRFNAEIGVYEKAAAHTMVAVEDVEAWVRTTLEKVGGIIGSMQIHVNADSSRTTITYAFDRESVTMQRVHEVTQPKSSRKTNEQMD